MLEVEVASHFYLQAFINLKFKREFIRRVWRGMFKLHKTRKLLACGSCKKAAVESLAESTRSGQQGEDVTDSGYQESLWSGGCTVLRFVHILIFCGVAVQVGALCKSRVPRVRVPEVFAPHSDGRLLFLLADKYSIFIRFDLFSFMSSMTLGVLAAAKQ